ncbi:nitric oxide-associated protein 1 [Teleopsis dalmanni]|uniref:nitric oxide-associated protein 1 n=1 Tax=Teleopsis dalmanni TaxID=139649 RepID=UPI0018CE4636|nr:nitric oxide-associated protein 1 [Teleopsis dalmanni]
MSINLNMIKLNKVYLALNINYYQKLRQCCNAKVLDPVSARSRAWQRVREKYDNYVGIVYNSTLERQNSMSNKKRISLNMKFQNNVNTYTSNNKFVEIKSLNTKPAAIHVPTNWMNDYEFYSDVGSNNRHGTEDSKIPPSKVPCGGCGAFLQCSTSVLPGFIPVEIFKGRTPNELKQIVCKRCHFLKHYNIALDVEVTPETYVDTISRIKDKFALAVIIVDLLDFPCSIWPKMSNVLGNKRPVFIVGNKVDLLPRDSNNYLEHIKKCLKSEIVQHGVDVMNIKHVSLISAKTGYGVEELITQLHKIWNYKGNVYIMGCTNVGKSSLFNILLNSDYCRPQASNLVPRATTCPWPGTTLEMLKFPILRPSSIRVFKRFKRLVSERADKNEEQNLRLELARKTGLNEAAQPFGSVRRTFDNREDVNDVFSISLGMHPIISINERSAEYAQARWCYDTPGVMHPAQITNLLSSEELKLLEPKEIICPRAVILQPGFSILLGGLARLDLIECKNYNNGIKVFAFSSPQLPITVAQTTNACDIYKKYLGTEILGFPFGSEERLNQWPGLQCRRENLHMVAANGDVLSGDIVLSSAGWIGVYAPTGCECVFQAWTPYARGIFLRTPALVPNATRLIGKRIRNTLAYNLSKPFVFKK